MSQPRIIVSDEHRIASPLINALHNVTKKLIAEDAVDSGEINQLIPVMGLTERFYPDASYEQLARECFDAAIVAGVEGCRSSKRFSGPRNTSVLTYPVVANVRGVTMMAITGDNDTAMFQSEDEYASAFNSVRGVRAIPARYYKPTHLGMLTNKRDHDGNMHVSELDYTIYSVAVDACGESSITIGGAEPHGTTLVFAVKISDDFYHWVSVAVIRSNGQWEFKCLSRTNTTKPVYR